MDSLGALIEIANNSCDFEVLTTSITERDALEEGRRGLPASNVMLNKYQIELIFRDWKFPIISYLFNTATGRISEAGSKILDDVRSIHQDLDFLLCYFSKYSSTPSVYTEIVPNPLDAFTFLNFAQELFESFSMLSKEMVTERQVLSEVIKKVILSSKSLLKQPNIGKLALEVMKITRDINKESLAVLKPIYQEALLAAVQHKRLDPGAIDKSGEKLIREVCRDQTLADELERNYSKFASLVHSITLLQNNVSRMDTDWVYTSQYAPDLVEEAKKSLLFYSELISAGGQDKFSEGNVMLTVSVDWEKKFEDARMTRTCFVEIDYMKTTFRIKLNAAPFEYIVPVFAEGSPMNVRLMYIIKKFEKTPLDKVPPEGYGVLCDLQFVLNNRSNKVVEKFKRRNSAIAAKCGTLTVDAVYYPSDAVIPMHNPPFHYEDPKLLRLLDFYVHRMIKKWMTDSSVMDICPPHDMYIALLEFAIRYSVPVTTVYLRIAEKMMDGWCHAESYLSAFTAIFLCAFMSMEKCGKTPSEEQTWAKIVAFLKEQIPVFIMQHMSKVGLYERHAVLPLFVLSCFVVEEDSHVYPFIDNVMEKSLDNIMHSVTGMLQANDSDVEVPAANDLLKYVQNIKKSTTPALEDDAEKSESRFQVFEMPTLANTCECLAKRARQLQKFYEEAMLPAFMDHWDSLHDKLKDLAIVLIKNFSVVERRACETDLFKFILNYKIIYKVLDMPEEYSPYVIFTPLILDWISKIGEKIIEWVGNAIKIDKFVISNQRDRTSTSVSDMMRIFSQSLEFLHTLGWEDNSIDAFLETYLSLCASCLKFYVDEMTIKMISYFPLAIVEAFQDEYPVFSGYISQVKWVDSSNVTPSSIFITMNNLFFIQTLWKGFIDSVHSRFPNFEINDVFKKPASNVNVICKAIPSLFAQLTAHEVTRGVAAQLWVSNSRMKTLMSKKASKEILNPMFMQRNSDLFISKFDNTTEFIKNKIDALEGTICSPYYKMMLRGFINGLDVGLMNTLLSKHKTDPIKHKRLCPVINFIQDVLADVMTYLTDKPDANITPELFEQYTPYSKYIIQHLSDSPEELIQSDPKDENPMISLCIYLIVSSHNKEKEIVKWTKANKSLHLGLMFKPNNK